MPDLGGRVQGQHLRPDNGQGQLINLKEKLGLEEFIFVGDRGW